MSSPRIENGFEITLKGFIAESKKYITGDYFGITCVIAPGQPLWEKKEKMGIRYDENGDWYYKDNTMKERLRRLDLAFEFGRKLGFIESSSKKKECNIPVTYRKTYLRKLESFSTNIE